MNNWRDVSANWHAPASTKRVRSNSGGGRGSVRSLAHDCMTDSYATAVISSKASCVHSAFTAVSRPYLYCNASIQSSPRAYKTCRETEWYFVSVSTNATLVCVLLPAIRSWERRARYLFYSMFILLFLPAGLRVAQPCRYRIVFTHWPKNGFFAPQVPTFTFIGAEMWEYSPQNCQNVEFLPEICTSGATHLQYCYEILSIFTRLKVTFKFFVWSLSRDKHPSYKHFPAVGAFPPTNFQ